jgi:flagellar biosynthesis protein FlhA
MNSWLQRLKTFTSNSDMLVAAAIVLVLAVMIVPVGPVMMDVFIALVFAVSMMILFLSLYSGKPLDFSTFPTILLIVTLFRLAINVASTRNILIHGGNEGNHAAGQIIYSFGNFVLGGNYVVGIIIFIILVIINFIVITKGAGRVAEVAARFTLDAMPGKQMAIDADLNAGLITDKEAKRRREEIAQEADFYGSMDGASKFVRGDAIAGIIITAVNVVGGIIIGVAQNGMSFSDAAKVFTLLTVGDGLVAQIPAIIISTAAGILITRNTSENTLGKQIGIQFNLQPKVLQIVAGVLALMGLIPNFPTLIFFGISAVMFYAAREIDKNNKQAAIVKVQEEEKSKVKAENLEDLLALELVELEVGYGLVSAVDATQNGDLLERITQIRKQFVLDWGVIVPSVRIKDNLELKPGGYKLKIKGIEVASGELVPDHFMAMDPGTVIDKIDGIATKEPVFGLPAVWITEDLKEEAMYNGYTVVDISTVIATHLTEVLKLNLHELFGRQELVRLLDNFKQEHPKIVSDLIPDILSLGLVLRVMKNLLKEGVSIRDLRTILESLADAGLGTKDSDVLTESVRQALYRTITERIKSDKGDVPLFTLDKGLEEFLLKNINQSEQGTILNIDAKSTQSILASITEKIEEATRVGEKMVLLCSPYVRRHLKRLTEKFIPNLVVISHNEISSDTHIRSLGTIRL